MAINETALQAALTKAAAATTFVALSTALKAAAAAIAPVVVPPTPPVRVAPAPPTNIKYTVSSVAPYTVTATFDTMDATLADGADLYRDGTNVAWDRGSIPHVDANVPVGTHVYHMTAYNEKGEGTPSADVSVVVPAIVVVVPPTPAPIPTPTPASTTFPQVKGIFTWDAGTVALTKTYEKTLDVPKFDIMLEHLDMTSWTTLQSMWFGSAWAGQGYRMCITFCPFPNGNTLAQAASGQFDSNWKNMLNMIAAVFPDAILRFAHEQNCCYPWKASADPANYIKMWQRWAPLARAASSKFVLCWNPIYGDGDIPMENTYPGDQYVDLMGLDVYDFKGGWASGQILNSNHGLNWFASYAKTHTKPMMLCEWGAATYPSVPTQDGGDDPAFMQGIYDWCMATGASNIIYNDNNTGVHSVLDDGTKPLSLDKYRRTFGTLRSVANPMLTAHAPVMVKPSAAHTQAVEALRAAKGCN